MVWGTAERVTAGALNTCSVQAQKSSSFMLLVSSGCQTRPQQVEIAHPLHAHFTGAVLGPESHRCEVHLPVAGYLHQFTGLPHQVSYNCGLSSLHTRAIWI